MKKISILCLLSLQSLAQLLPSHGGVFLDKNKVKATIHSDNDKFWNIYGNTLAAYEVPVGKGTHAMFCNSVWIGGLDPGGLLHLSANTYKQSGTDFWPGPLDTSNISAFTSSNSVPYNRLWKVDCNDINNFVTAFNAGSVQAQTYSITTDMATYPAIGTANFQRQMEPFMDVNGNGIYDPYNDGDYPIIKGQQQVLSIYNDYNGYHTESFGRQMGLEIHERSYAYSEPNIADSMQAINYSTFYHYTIYNRSNVDYHNVYITDWSDVDLGNYTDDYVGTDSANNFVYCYNGNPTDPNIGNMIKGYGNKPPVMSHAIMKTDCSSDGVDNDNDGIIDEPGEQFLLNRSTYYNNYGVNIPSATNNPIDTAIYYYNYMQGAWKNNMPFTYGGTGYGGTVPSNYVYTGNPGTNTGWTESTAGNVPGDRRILFSSGPFNLPAGSKVQWGYTLVFSQDTTQVVNTITEFDSRVRRDVKNVKYYDETHQLPQCVPAIAVGIQQQQAKKLNSLVYPNPTSDFLTIDLNDNVKTASVTLMDLSGRVILSSSITNGYRGKLDLSQIEKGIYLVEVQSGDRKITDKVIKN